MNNNINLPLSVCTICNAFFFFFFFFFFLGGGGRYVPTSLCTVISVFSCLLLLTCTVH